MLRNRYTDRGQQITDKEKLMMDTHHNISMEDWLSLPIHLHPPCVYQDGVIERMKSETYPNALNAVLIPKDETNNKENNDECSGVKLSERI